MSIDAALSALSKEMLLAIKNMAEGIGSTLRTRKLDKQLMLQTMDIMMAPKRAEAAVFNATIEASKSVNKLLSSAIIAKSPELGKIGMAAGFGMAKQLELASDALDDINMLNSVMSMDSLDIEKIDDMLKSLDDIIQKVQKALAALS